MNQEEKFNWEKLLKHLEGDKEAEPGAEELNQEELEMLLLAEEMTMRLKGIDPEKQFPVEPGWEELQTRYEAQNKQEAVMVNWNKWYRLMAVAAMFVAVIGAGWWFQFRQTEPIKTSQHIAAQIQLTLANGEQVELAASQAPVLKSEGASFNGSTLVYKKESELAPVTAEKLSINTLEVPYGKQTRLELSDGTVVWVNAGSKLSYPTRFAASKRELTLDGEAFFEVSHDLKRPFIVHVGALNVQVLGTAFNINNFGATVQTALVRGKVSLETANQSLILLPGDLGAFQEQQGKLSKSKADLKRFTAWKDEEIYFDNNTLEEIVFRLKREYNLSFVFEDAELKRLHFTVDMPKDDIQKVLNNIRLSTNEVSFVVKGNVVEVKRR
ncbi:FecR domain-containing protein [Pedobacter sp. PLR]|uniref:FecR family protein n=1 Tax=Pedobacter sp. PLR TaxID=2994465 RepID=UPI002247C001|nr:FecR domain-containing protein [Pedobacter sp. PLR]MCX2453644.1 FecR domain-containing protein [Pedobacter sp. PLR]